MEESVHKPIEAAQLPLNVQIEAAKSKTTKPYKMTLLNASDSFSTHTLKWF